jgi:glycosyltransferase involved in cell wall biosynthesis
MADAPTVSVVIPTYRRRQLLDGLLNALAMQRDAPAFEVVVVDDCSNDGTAEAIERRAADVPFPLKVLRMPRNGGPAAARNAGWRSARGSYIAFTDDDCTPDPGWLAALAGGLERADVVQGRTVADVEGMARMGAFGRSLAVDEEGLYPTANMGYRREVLERLGGFDEHFRHPAGEDTDLAWRAREEGASTAFVPDAVVVHAAHAYSYADFLREKFRWEGVVLVVSRHPGLRRYFHSHWFWRPSHPPALLAAAGLAAGAWAAAGTARSGGLHARHLGVAVAGIAALAPYHRYRMRRDPLFTRRRNQYLLLPAVLAGDLLEIAVVVRASLRYRTLVL